MKVLDTQSCLTLCNLMDCSLPGSSVHGISQARILEWVAISFSRDLPHPGIELSSLESPALASGFFTTSTTWEEWIKHINVKSLGAYIVSFRNSSFSILQGIGYRTQTMVWTNLHWNMDCHIASILRCTNAHFFHLLTSLKPKSILQWADSYSYCH